MTRYYYKQQLEKRKAIEQLRTKISNDLHDDVGSVLSGLAMQSEMMSFQYKDEDKASLQELSVMSRSAIDRMRDIVWAMNSNRDKYENLLDRMKSFASAQFKNSKIDYTFKLVGIEGSSFISPEIRQNVYFIYKEAITNLLKHSDGDMAEISLEKSKTTLLMSIKDNGTGKKEASKEGLGLASMKSRAEKINAKLTIEDDEGFAIQLNLPM